MALVTRVWKDLKDYSNNLPTITIEGVEAWPKVIQNSIGIVYKGGALILPNTYIVDTIETEE